MWAECARTATDLENICVRKNTSAHEKLFNEKSKIGRELRTFGEMGVVKKLGVKIASKLENKGEVLMFVGYEQKHAINTYRMLNMSTYYIVVTRDIKWLNITFGDFKKISKEDRVNLPVLEFWNEKNKDSMSDNEGSSGGILPLITPVVDVENCLLYTSPSPRDRG